MKTLPAFFVVDDEEVMRHFSETFLTSSSFPSELFLRPMNF